ncbi:MAG TPA: NAD(P)H-dependent oxidoreductase, partial [Ramlibacter sp.]|nr:NAD(P)H-dependent oxidoreductase [Ramlibacter sp.]
WPHLGTALWRKKLPDVAQDALAAIEAADFLVVASPVYRATYTGLFKHLFDFVDQNALAEKPVLLAATGGSDRHALVIDHQLRPLFSFFQSRTLPIGVYGTDRDFTDYQVTDGALSARIDLAVERALPFLGATSRVVEEPAAVALAA